MWCLAGKFLPRKISESFLNVSLQICIIMVLNITPHINIQRRVCLYNSHTQRYATTQPIFPLNDDISASNLLKSTPVAIFDLFPNHVRVQINTTSYYDLTSWNVSSACMVSHVNALYILEIHGLYVTMCANTCIISARTQIHLGWEAL